MNNQNLRPFGTLPPEERRELSRRGGIASGERRREIAEIKYKVKIYAAGALVHESREEYRQAIKRYVAVERKKARRRRQR